MAEPDRGTSEYLSDWLAAVDRRWAWTGIPGRNRRQMVSDLREYLLVAIGGGATVEELVGIDAGRFADDLARSNGAARRVGYGGLLVTSLVGALIGVLLAWNVVYPVLSRLDVDWVAVAMFVNLVAAATVVGCLLATVWWRYRSDPAIWRTIHRMAVLVTVAGILAIVPTAALARAANYSFHPLVLLAEGASVAVLLTGATVLARWSATRSSSA